MGGISGAARVQVSPLDDLATPAEGVAQTVPASLSWREIHVYITVNGGAAGTGSIEIETDDDTDTGPTPYLLTRGKTTVAANQNMVLIFTVRAGKSWKWVKANSGTGTSSVDAVRGRNFT